MRSKFILTVAASLLAGTIAASAQGTGAPNERGQVDQKTDGAATSTTPNRQGGTQGTVGSGAKKNNPAMKDDTPSQPGGISPSAPPQGGAGGSGAQPQRK
jgi:hypothetical protein